MMNKALIKIPYRVAIIVCALLFTANSVLRGMHFPNLWAYTHFLFPCADFFVKRTLVGCAVEKLSISYFYSYQFFSYISVAVTSVFVIYMLRHIYFVACSEHISVALLALVFSTCPALAFLSSITGYFDFFGFLIVATVFAVRSLYIKIGLATVFFSLSIAIHEAIPIVFLPLVFAHICIVLEKGNNKKIKVSFVSIIFVTLLVVDLLVANSKGSPELATRMQEAVEQKAHISVPSDIFSIFSRDIAENKQKTSNVFLFYFGDLLTGVTWYIKNSLFAVIFLALANFFILRFVTSGFLLAAVFTLLPLSPLALTFIGYDWIRWASWAMVNSFLLFCFLVKSGAENHLPTHIIWRMLTLSVCLYGLLVDFPLLNGQLKPFPYTENRQYIRSVLSGGKVIPDLPEFGQSAEEVKKNLGK